MKLYAVILFFSGRIVAFFTINEQIQKEHKEALQERMAAPKGKTPPNPQVKKK